MYPEPFILILPLSRHIVPDAEADSATLQYVTPPHSPTYSQLTNLLPSFNNHFLFMVRNTITVHKDWPVYLGKLQIILLYSIQYLIMIVIYFCVKFLFAVGAFMLGS